MGPGMSAWMSRGFQVWRRASLPLELPAAGYTRAGIA